jgi:class 3 adenylate cyclase
MKDAVSVTRWVSGEFIDGVREQGFRDHQLSAEVRQIRLIWVIALCFFLLYGGVDYWLFGPQVSYLLLFPRLVILLVGTLAVVATLSVAGRKHRDLIGFMALLLVSVSYALLLQRRDPGPASPGALLLLVIGIYMFTPGRYWMICGNAVLCSAVSVLLLAGAAGAETRLQYSYLVPANLLAALALGQLNQLRRRAFLAGELLRAEVLARRRAQHGLAFAHHRSRELLHNALPASIAQQLQQDPHHLPAQDHAVATVLFADLVGFTSLSRKLTPRQLLQLLNNLFSAFDELAAQFSLEKIKTVGDAYMAVAGVTEILPQPQERAARMALALVERCDLATRQWGLTLRLRVGIHCGPLVAGVIGRQRLAFDIWGETVNIASRLQSAAPAGRILVSQAVREGCPGKFLFGPSRRLQLRGCGVISASTLYSKASVVKLTNKRSGYRLR